MNRGEQCVIPLHFLCSSSILPGFSIVVLTVGSSLDSSVRRGGKLTPKGGLGGNVSGVLGEEASTLPIADISQRQNETMSCIQES